MVAKKTALKTVIKGLGPVEKARLVVQSNLEELCGRPPLIDDADLRLIHTSLDAVQGRNFNDYLDKADRLGRYVSLLAEKVWRLKAALYERDRILWSLRTAGAIVEDRGFAKVVPEARLDRNRQTVVPPGIELTRHELLVEPEGETSNSADRSGDQPFDGPLAYWQADLTPGMEKILQEIVANIRQKAAELKPHLLKARRLAEELALEHYTTRLDQLEALLAEHDLILENVIERFIEDGAADRSSGVKAKDRFHDSAIPVGRSLALDWPSIVPDQHREDECPDPDQCFHNNLR